MTIRYMGTKAWLANVVAGEISRLAEPGSGKRIGDLFAGTGAVTQSLAEIGPVLANDSQQFVHGIAQARFRPRPRRDIGRLLARAHEAAAQHANGLLNAYADMVEKERAALAAPIHEYNEFMISIARDGGLPSLSRGNYDLAVRYFGCTYFTLTQAAWLDGIRLSIDQSNEPPSVQNWLRASLLIAASRFINTPGHGAQFLKATDDAMGRRIKRLRSRAAWPEFASSVASCTPVGAPEWRRRNRVTNLDAREAATKDLAVAYADPPYTRDHYERMYHVYETLWRYDYPRVSGAGLTRCDWAPSDFSTKTRVVAAMKDLLETLAAQGIPLILSYPVNGLLEQAGVSLADMLQDYYGRVSVLIIPSNYSTQGNIRRSGPRTQGHLEALYVCA